MVKFEGVYKGYICHVGLADCKTDVTSRETKIIIKEICDVEKCCKGYTFKQIIYFKCEKVIVYGIATLNAKGDALIVAAETKKGKSPHLIFPEKEKCGIVEKIAVEGTFFDDKNHNLGVGVTHAKRIEKCHDKHAIKY